MEDYPYIFPIPTGNVQNELNSRVSIYIPSDNNSNAYFTNYIIFYRIYISNEEYLSPSEEIFRSINVNLYNDHIRVRPYIGNDSMGSSSLETLFKNMNYYTLETEGIDIDSVLSKQNSNLFSNYLTIDFSRDSGNSTIPYLTTGSGPRYNLLRNSGAGVYVPIPEDRYFLNSAEMRNPDNIYDSFINGDITDKPDTPRNHTYVNLYIIASGIDSITFAPLYSSPAHIGVLRLPNQN